MSSKVRTGLDVLRGRGFDSLLGRRVGLLAHPASVDGSLSHASQLMQAAGVRLEALLGPEHGLSGALQDMESAADEDGARDPVTGARVFSLYGHDADSLRAIEILASLEKAFNIQIAQESLAQMVNLDGVYNVVKTAANWEE